LNDLEIENSELNKKCREFFETIKIKEGIINKFYSEKEKIYGKSNTIYGSETGCNRYNSYGINNSDSNRSNRNNGNEVNNNINSGKSDNYFNNQNQMFKSELSVFTPQKQKSNNIYSHRNTNNNINIINEFGSETLPKEDVILMEAQRINSDSNIETKLGSSNNNSKHTRSDSFIAMLKNIFYTEKNEKK